MVTIGMMCHALTATTTPVSKVIGVQDCQPHLEGSAPRHLTTLKKNQTPTCRLTRKTKRFFGIVTSYRRKKLRVIFVRKTTQFTNCARKTAGRRFVTLVTKISGIADSVRGLRFPCANKLLPFKDRASLKIGIKDG